MERRSHSSTGANPVSDPRIVRRTRSGISNSSSPHAANGRSGSRKSAESGEIFDEEALTEDDEEGEMVPRLRSLAEANSLSESPADVGNQNSSSSFPVGDPLSDTPIKTLDGQGSDGGDGIMVAGETFDVEAQDDKEVAEGLSVSDATK